MKETTPLNDNQVNDCLIFAKNHKTWKNKWKRVIFWIKKSGI